MTGCAGPNRVSLAGAPCNRVWDNIDYKQLGAGAEEENDQESQENGFGACSEDDLANFGVGNHTGHSHHR